MRSLAVFAIITFLTAGSPGAADAGWVLNGTALSTAANNQSSHTIVSDGAGGAIVTWRDYRNGMNYDVYAQRVDAAGTPQWTAHGVALSTAANDQSSPTIVPDGAGGAIVTWHDYRSGTNHDIYAQRVDAAGTPQWTADGVALSTAANDQSSPTIVPDGAGGAIVTWLDYRSGTNYDIYARRVDASGTPQWTTDGVALCTAANEQANPTIAPDGAGGAIVTWQDYRSGTNYDIYAQRVDAAGTPQWTAQGVVLSTALNDQASPMIVPDGAGGAVVTWQDYRSGTNYDIYAQRVNASGTPQWTTNGANGLVVCTAAINQLNPTIASDGAGGAIVTWHDHRSGTNADIYAQRVDGSGTPQWTGNGVALCTAAIDQLYPTIVPDGVGGAVVSWHDHRSGTNADIYAQRVDAAGTPQWPADGVGLCTAASDQAYPRLVPDGAGGAIVAWFDYRVGTSSDIYAQRVERSFGTWGHPEPMAVSATDVPGDQGGKVAVNWKASGHDVVNLQTISHYSIWRAVDAVAFSWLELTSGAEAAFVDPADVGADFAGPAFAHERIADTDYYWEWIGNQTAAFDPGYSYSASTRADSVAGDPAVHYFRVIAHTSNPYVLYKSGAVSGYSTDNLAPLAPLYLTAQRVGNDVQLQWNRVRVSDLRDYSLYRATAAGVEPLPFNFLGNSLDTLAVDTGAPQTTLHYIVTAYDVHGNQSDPSNEAVVSGATGVGGTPALTSLSLRQNSPNPFAGSTEIEIGLPGAATVEIEVYDVTGRRVRSLSLPRQEAGWKRVHFDGRNDAGTQLASGVYFYRVRAGAETLSRKMVIAR